LLLVSRSGPDAVGAGELAAELAGLGATVDIVACDLANREAVRRLVADVPAEHPLTAVVHAAGALDDGVITSLSAERVAAVLRPKADAAMYLHELTAELDLAAFVLFSSGSAMFGGAGQGNYAAANALLDALAAPPACNWPGGPVARLGPVGSAKRIDRAPQRGRPPANQPFRPATESAATGLALFDAAISVRQPCLAPMPITVAALRGRTVPPLLRALAPAPTRPVAAGHTSGESTALVGRLASLGGAERARVLLDVVCAHVAAVLGHPTPDSVDTFSCLP